MSSAHNPLADSRGFGSAGKYLRDGKASGLLKLAALLIGIGGVAFFVVRGIGSESATPAETGEERLIPFLPNMLKLSELARRNELNLVDEEELQEIHYIPYKTAMQLCKSPHFFTEEASDTKPIYEISIGNSGSTWQIITLTAIAAAHGYHLPVHHVSLEDVEAWTSLEDLKLNVQHNDKMDYTKKPLARMYKLQHFVEELYEKAYLMYNAFKIIPGKMDEVNQFAQGVCPCCFLNKNSLGHKETEIALIYMHAFSMGFDMNDDQITEVRYALAEWISRHYCYPGSVHTSACQVLADFPDLKGFHPELYTYEDTYHDEDAKEADGVDAFDLDEEEEMGADEAEMQDDIADEDNLPFVEDGDEAS